MAHTAARRSPRAAAPAARLGCWSLLLLGACTGYVAPEDRPLAAHEAVRLAFARPQRLVLLRDGAPAPGARPERRDTVDGVTAVYGRLRTSMGDTMLVELTQLVRASGRAPVRRGTTARIPWASTTAVQRWGYSPPRTLGLAAALLGVAVAAWAVVGRGLAT